MKAGRNIYRKGTAKTLYAVAAGCQLPTSLGFLSETARETFAEFRGRLLLRRRLDRTAYPKRQPAFVRFPRSRGYDRFRSEKRWRLTKDVALGMMSCLKLCRLGDVLEAVADEQP